jgi:hypothetical protein
LENTLPVAARQRHLIVIPVDANGAPTLGAIVKVRNSSSQALIGMRIVEPAQGNLQPPSELHFGLPSLDDVDVTVSFHTPAACIVEFRGCSPNFGFAGLQNRLLVVHPGSAGTFVHNCPVPSPITGMSGTTTGTSTAVPTTTGAIASPAPTTGPAGASSSAGGSDQGFPWIIVVIAAVVALLLAGAIAFIALRRRRSMQDSSSSAVDLDDVKSNPQQVEDNYHTYPDNASERENYQNIDGSQSNNYQTVDAAHEPEDNYQTGDRSNNYQTVEAAQESEGPTYNAY